MASFGGERGRVPQTPRFSEEFSSDSPGKGFGIRLAEEGVARPNNRKTCPLTLPLKEMIMSSHLVLNGCDDAVKARLEAYWAKKLPRLQKFLVPYPADLQEISLTVSCHEQTSHRAWYEARAVIHLPTGTLAAEANDKEPQAVLDRIADTLASEIKRHKKRVRKDYVYKRKTRQRADLSAAGPLLQRDVERCWTRS
jgi:ribosome-associated translation inhibitor RaiA